MLEGGGKPRTTRSISAPNNSPGNDEKRRAAHPNARAAIPKPLTTATPSGWRYNRITLLSVLHHAIVLPVIATCIASPIEFGCGSFRDFLFTIQTSKDNFSRIAFGTAYR